MSTPNLEHGKNFHWLDKTGATLNPLENQLINTQEQVDLPAFRPPLLKDGELSTACSRPLEGGIYRDQTQLGFGQNVKLS